MVSKILSTTAKLLQGYLRLEHNVVGVSLINKKNMNDTLEYSLINEKHSFCQMVQKGSQGSIFRVFNEHFSCDTAARIMGIREYLKSRKTLMAGMMEDFMNLSI